MATAAATVVGTATATRPTALRLMVGVIATIIWKRVDGVWKESRYHSSLVGVEKI